VQDFLVDTQARIRAMSLLHETLYMSDNLARVSFRHYVHTVCAQAVRTYASDARHIRIREDIAEAMLPIDQAIPAGLILNELLSNALKHAFGDRTRGEIAVALRATDEHHLELSVRDDGIGLPANHTGEPSGTLGLLLVENLTRQLGGELRVSREGGTAFRILFPIATP
jgi:two-component sensor histidine kinase